MKDRFEKGAKVLLTAEGARYLREEFDVNDAVEGVAGTFITDAHDGQPFLVRLDGLSEPDDGVSEGWWMYEGGIEPVVPSSVVTIDTASPDVTVVEGVVYPGLHEMETEIGETAIDGVIDKYEGQRVRVIVQRLPANE